jgi:hypothetical protein
VLPKLQNRGARTHGPVVSVRCIDLTRTISLSYESGDVMGEPSSERVVGAVLAHFGEYAFPEGGDRVSGR